MTMEESGVTDTSKFRCGDSALIKGTCNPMLDGKICTVMGKYIHHVIDYYVVQLKFNFEKSGFVSSSIVLPEENLISP